MIVSCPHIYGSLSVLEFDFIESVSLLNTDYLLNEVFDWLTLPHLARFGKDPIFTFFSLKLVWFENLLILVSINSDSGLIVVSLVQVPGNDRFGLVK